jgi:hypothetical protein
VKNIVVCFDHTQEQEHTSVASAFSLLDDASGQVVWCHRGIAADVGRARLRWRQTVVDQARAAVVAAYRFLVDAWAPGDALYVFGAGRGGACAAELARLLGAIGVVPDDSDPLLDYVMANLVLPRTARTPQDWHRVNRLTGALTDRGDVAVPVDYLGLWDVVRLPGVPVPELSTVAAGRHAMAIDGGPFGGALGPHTAGRVDDVWFRGAHCDIAGGRGGCRPLADIATDWVLDGATRLGLVLHDERKPAPGAFDPLAGSAHPMAPRRVPTDAAVHASVGMYLRAHPQYWRRLPGRFAWADAGWLDRGERLVPSTPAVPAAEVLDNRIGVVGYA